MDIYFLFFENFETLDIFGPIEILSRIDNATLHYISLQGGLIKSRQGYAIKTVSTIECRPNSVLVIPGGQGTRKLVNDDIFISKLLNFPTSKLPKTPEEMWDRRDKNTH